MNEQEVIEQIKKGNSNAFRYFMNQHKRLVYHILWRRVGKRDSIDDLAQDVFLRCYKQIKTFKYESKLSTWVAAIAYHTCTDYLRKKSRVKVDYYDDLKNDTLLDEPKDLPLEVMNQNEIKSVLQAGMNQLPHVYRTIIGLFYLEEFSLQEIHEITNIPIGTIKSQLSRGKKMLRSILEQQNGSEPQQMYKDN